MNNNVRLKAIILIAVMLILCMGASILYGYIHREEDHSTYSQKLEKAPLCDNPTEGIRVFDDYSVSEDFTTHLPLVILELPEGEPPISMQKGDNGDFVVIEGVDPFVDGKFYLINNDEGLNKASDIPEIETNMVIRRRGNTSILYEKAQWAVKFYTESGQYADYDVLGMGKEHTWILNGSLADKSMLRNYLAYSIASEFMPYVPDNQYCEVLLKKDGKLSYQGVYLIGESIKQGPDRIDVANYSSSDTVNSYIVRRDRYDQEGLMLDTYGRPIGYPAKYIGLIYPAIDEVTDEMVEYVTKDISEVEKVLYSKNDKIFYTYGEVIDVDSFVDYFLLNEFFLSYDAGLHSTYAYKDLGGKLSMGPVWDFDGTMDNYVDEPAEPADLGFQIKPWYVELCNDKAFVQKLINRYAELRTGPLSDTHITEKINEILEHLGGAKDREWLRWNKWYTGVFDSPNIGLKDYVLEDGSILYRNAETLEDELYRVRTALHDHGEAIPGALNELRNGAKRDSGLNRWKEWLLVLTLLVFILPSVYVVIKKD